MNSQNLIEDERCEYNWVEKGIPPSITDGVHRNENFEEIIPVFQLFQTFSN